MVRCPDAFAPIRYKRGNAVFKSQTSAQFRVHVKEEVDPSAAIIKSVNITGELK